MKKVRVIEYSDFDEAVGSLTKKDKEYILVWHSLKKGEKIRSHYHPKANEWILVKQGEIEVEVGDQQIEICVQGKYLVVPLPKMKKHSLLAKTDVRYFVLRDKKDQIIYWGR